MTIERSNDNRVQFKSLRTGDVFVGANGSVFMCIENVAIRAKDFNAVNLENGLLYRYDESIYVDKRPNAILKI